MSGRNQHVVPSSSGWGVRSSGAERATRVFHTRKEALDYARQVARRGQSELFVHDRAGMVRDHQSFGVALPPAKP